MLLKPNKYTIIISTLWSEKNVEWKKIKLRSVQNRTRGLIYANGVVYQSEKQTESICKITPLAGCYCVTAVIVVVAAWDSLESPRKRVSISNY